MFYTDWGIFIVHHNRFKSFQIFPIDMKQSLIFVLDLLYRSYFKMLLFIFKRMFICRFWKTSAKGSIEMNLAFHFFRDGIWSSFLLFEIYVKLKSTINIFCCFKTCVTYFLSPWIERWNFRFFKCEIFAGSTNA